MTQWVILAATVLSASTALSASVIQASVAGSSKSGRGFPRILAAQRTSQGARSTAATSVILSAYGLRTPFSAVPRRIVGHRRLIAPGPRTDAPTRLRRLLLRSD